MEDSAIIGLAWAGICMLYSYALWEGNILDFFYHDLNRMPVWLGKPLGLCEPCFCIWFGIPFAYLMQAEYFVFLGVSGMVMMIFKIILLFYQKQQ